MTFTKPVIVGSFTLGGLALGVLAILLLGGSQLFTTRYHAVVVFSNSVSGLEVGSPVTFRGVNIGKVEAMKVQVNAASHSGVIPVYLALDSNRIYWTNGPARTGRLDLQEAVAAGLRAQLSSQSLVTGLLSVDLDFHPGAPAVAPRVPDEMFEIPTISSDMQNIKDELRDVKLPELANQTRAALSGIQQALNQVNTRIGPLADSLQITVDTTQTTIQTLQKNTTRTLNDIDQLAIESRRQIAVNGRDLDQLLLATERIATQAEHLVASLDELTSPRSPLRGDLRASLRDLAASASSLRTFTHNLERNPAATLLGRPSK